ncbi:hypothetical protein AURDEDRAFT_181609 [Auricularia subglabra TFB-10046 SS5]|nr:hypothetical protein AURDEDRAFT_181609 [Auricularia subglabra TFB-10046 SS5]
MPVSPRVERSTRRQDIEKAKIYTLSRQLATSLQYAKLKVDHGWTGQNLNEVENLYSHYRRGPRPPPLAQHRAATARQQRSQARAASQAAQAAITIGSSSATRPQQPPATTQRNGSAPAEANGAAAEDEAMDVDDDSDYEDEDGGDDMGATDIPAGGGGGGGGSSKTPSVPPRSATPPRLEPSALPHTPASAAPRVGGSAPPLTAAHPGVLGSPVTVTPSRTRAPSKTSTPAAELPTFPPNLIAAITERGVDPGVLQAALANRRNSSSSTKPAAPLTSPFGTKGSSKPAAANTPSFSSSGTGVGLGGKKPLTYDTFFPTRDYSQYVNSSNPTIAFLSQRLRELDAPPKPDGTPSTFTAALPSATIPYGSGGASGSGNGAAGTASAGATPPVNPAEAAARAARLGVSRRPSPSPDGPAAPSTRASRRTSAPRQLI